MCLDGTSAGHRPSSIRGLNWRAVVHREVDDTITGLAVRSCVVRRVRAHGLDAVLVGYSVVLLVLALLESDRGLRLGSAGMSAAVLVLLARKWHPPLAVIATFGLVVVGILTDDPEAPARDFIAQYGATWPTVTDASKAIKNAYRVAARPQTYFIDATGVIRSVQYGEMPAPDFERQYARIQP
mgnify:CR=1 FL=1